DVQKQKTAVAVGGIDTGWGGALAPYQQASTAWLQTLAPHSSYDRILNDNAFTSWPLRSSGAIGSSAAIGSTTGEAAPKPVSQMAFTRVQLPALKAISEIVLTDELLMLTTPAADQLFQTEMAKSVGLATDTKFTQLLAAGAGSSHASTGLTAAQFNADLALAYGSIQTEE